MDIDEGMDHERANVSVDSLPALMTEIKPLPDEKAAKRKEVLEFRRCVDAENADAEPNAVRRFIETRTSANSPLAFLDGLYPALEQLADMVDDWMERKEGKDA